MVAQLLTLFVVATTCCNFATAVLAPTEIKIGLHATAFVGTDIPSISWTLVCENSNLACRGVGQEAYRVRVVDGSNTTVYDSEQIISSIPQHELPGSKIVGLRSDEGHFAEVRVWSQGVESGSRVSFRTALLDPTVDFEGEWIGGSTAMRGLFKTDGAKMVLKATAFASGIGCFSMWLNDERVSNTTFMAPGWSFVPTVRVLYDSYDVTAMVKQGGNTVGVQLGFCKYGYEGAFCLGAHASNANCRAFMLQLNIKYTDGSSYNFR
jgi:alpha-L-rhamnosidase